MSKKATTARVAFLAICAIIVLSLTINFKEASAVDKNNKVVLTYYLTGIDDVWHHNTKWWRHK